ncbi:tyrosine-type recombinase/integrase [Bacillus salitolerans]|uniref:Tyrosine-type recombinase/integrase n=1 Tax=Bacillus salitolerans TaxID=1437434 RepID=A0ABW4LJH6_9BACI
MAIKIQSTVDYDLVCSELGITKEQLFSLSTAKVPKIKEPKIDEIIDNFLIHLNQLVNIGKRSESTFETYSNFLIRFKKYLSQKDTSIETMSSIYTLNEQLLYSFISTLEPRKNSSLSPYTLNKYTGIIKALLKYAYYTDYIEKDLTYKFENHKTEIFPRYFTSKQAKNILKVSLNRTYGYRWRAMVCFLLSTGCRSEEIVTVKVKDFDIENNIIRIMGKGKKERIVPLFPEVKRVILKYLEMSGTEWTRNHEGLLFCHDEGELRKKPILTRTIRYQVKNILSDSGLIDQGFSPHSFRHTFAVNCLRSGMNLAYLTQILGHTNPETTRIYVQLLPLDLRDEVLNKYPLQFEKLIKELID